MDRCISNIRSRRKSQSLQEMKRVSNFQRSSDNDQMSRPLTEQEVQRQRILRCEIHLTTNYTIPQNIEMSVLNIVISSNVIS